MEIKICGLTCQADIQSAIGLGATALGLVFYPPSKRYVEVNLAQQLRQYIPKQIKCVALVMNETAENIQHIIAKIQPDVLQFHGDLSHETPDFCAQFGVPYWKAVGMKNNQQVRQVCESYSDAEAWVLDSHEIGIMGGSGEVFDWQKIPQVLSHKIIVAGGLNPNNVADAIAAVRPLGVDVSSGVEFAAGRKCPQKMAAFIQAAQAADAK